jgi:GPI mannosyltransferase 3
MSRRRVNIALGAIVALGVVLRVLTWRYEPPHHPDEFFQYLEPAWGRLTGAGIETWEWRNGIRSWVLPGYHGAWMAILMRLGVHDGSTIAKLLQAHWALLSMSLVWAGWRGGLLLARQLGPNRDAAVNSGDESGDEPAPAGWQGGLVGALLCAAFPLQVRFSIHTLSEQASILCMVCALVLTADLASTAGRVGRGKAVFMGVLLGLGICLRIQHVPVPLVAVLWLLISRRFALAAVACAASLLPMLAFGLVDRLTWGGFFASFIHYVKFNLVEGGASIFGTMPWTWYWQQFLHRLPTGLPILGFLCLVGIRATWPFVASALGLTILLSTQAHKEERFVMLFWPLVLIAAAAVAGAWLGLRVTAVGKEGAQLGHRRLRTWLVRCVILAGLAVVLVDGARHGRDNDFPELFPARFEAQVWVGRQADVTGLLYDSPLYTGGYMWFSRNFPQLKIRSTLLGNPLFSHVLVPRKSEWKRVAERAGFAEVFSKDEMIVLRRTAEPVSESALRQ